MHRVIIVVAWIAGCPQPGAAQPRAAAALVPIEEVPLLAQDRGPDPVGAGRDCRLGPRLRERFRGARVRACGAVPRRAPFDARGEPFVVEQAIFGFDTEPSRGLVGVVERGRLVVYLASYDSALCTGAECPNTESGTTIWRCARLSPAGRERPLVAGIELRSACERDVTECFRCEAAREVERCTSGGRR